MPSEITNHAQVLGMMNNPHYLYRMTVLVAVAALAPVVSHDVLCNSMLPVVVAAAKDKVTSLFGVLGDLTVMQLPSRNT